MIFQDKYISTSDNDTTPDPKKIVISNEAYAIGEMLDRLTFILNKLRLTYK